MQGDVGPHTAVVVLEAAEGVEAENFFAQAVEGIVGVLVLGAEGFPDIAEFFEEDIELSVFNAAHPEFGFEMFDAEIDNFVLGAGEGFLNSGPIVLGQSEVGFLGETLPGAQYS